MATKVEKAKRAKRSKAPGTTSGKVQLSRPENVFSISIGGDQPRMTMPRVIRTTARIQKGLKSKKRRSR